MWCNSSRWKRTNKHQLKDEGERYFSDIDYSSPRPPMPGEDPTYQKYNSVPYFNIDFAGEADRALVTKYHNNQVEARKCIFREFVPDNQLADNYRLEVTTTPDDTEVIGWTIVQD
jgi:hypothetical protein